MKEDEDGIENVLDEMIEGMREKNMEYDWGSE